MKILIINPNSDPEMTERIQKTAHDFAPQECKAVCMLTPGAPTFIESYQDQIKAAPGMIQILKENEDAYDAFIVACHCDPHLDVLKEITTKPVVGIGEASMKIASMLGHSFSVISSTAYSIPQKEALVRKYHLEENLASVRAPNGEGNKDSYLKAAQIAVEQDKAEVIVLGCAGMTGLDKDLQQTLGVPVLDGVVCALMIAFGLAKYGVSQSNIKRVNPGI